MGSISGFEYWLDGKLQPIRTVEQLRGLCDERGMEYREFGGRFLLLDLSRVPEQYHRLFENGFWIGETTEVTE